jgi:hypothetical protein
MDISRLKKKLEPVLKNDAPNIGELCIIWIAEVIAYAIITHIEPFYMEGWFNVKFIMLRQVPPQEHEWRLKMDHLQGNEFQIDGHPVCVLALNLGSLAPPIVEDDSNVIKLQSWREMIDGKGKKDDPGGGGCPNQCDTPCS